MRRVLGTTGFWWFAVAAAFVVGGGLAGDVQATEDDLARLPVTDPYRCLTCHMESDPWVDSSLNVFGVDWLANNRLWDAELAQLDSDDDGCINGIEIGDSDGNGIPDGNVIQQAANPGVIGDCGSEALVDEKTWGTLKAMFDGR